MPPRTPVSPPEPTTGRAFDTASGDFDRLGVHLWQPIGAATVERTGPRQGEQVLDACCGTGASAIPAAHRVGPAGRVDAVDLSASLLAVLDGQAAGLPVRTYDADVTTWSRDGYDLVQCVLGIFFFPDMTAGAEHLIRRARPGGRVGFTVWRRGAMEAAGRHLQQAISVVTGIAVQPRPEHLIDQINDPDTYAHWLVERGLLDVEVTEHPHHVPTTPELAWLTITGSGFVGALAGLDEPQVERVRRAYLGSVSADGRPDFDATTLIGTGRRPGGAGR